MCFWIFSIFSPSFKKKKKKKHSKAIKIQEIKGDPESSRVALKPPLIQRIRPQLTSVLALLKIVLGGDFRIFLNFGESVFNIRVCF